MCHMTNPDEVREFIASERIAGADSDHFRAHANDAAKLALSYEDDARIFAGKPYGAECAAKAAALRESEALFRAVTLECEREEEEERQERAKREEERIAAYYAAEERRKAMGW